MLSHSAASSTPTGRGVNVYESRKIRAAATEAGVLLLPLLAVLLLSKTRWSSAAVAAAAAASRCVASITSMRN